MDYEIRKSRKEVGQAGGVLVVETVRKSGLDQAISVALAPWRKPRTVHDLGKILPHRLGRGHPRVLGWFSRRGRWLSYSVGMTISRSVPARDRAATRRDFARDGTGEDVVRGLGERSGSAAVVYPEVPRATLG